MNWPVIILITLTVLVAAACVTVAVIDTRATREHTRWMRRNEERRRRTSVEVAGISHGYRGMGLDGEADHPGAMHKRTSP
jgi:hypothetical protein